MNKQERDELIKEIKKSFEEAKKEMGFKASLEELDDVFFITEYILHEGYVGEEFPHQVCSRIRDSLNAWANYLHGLLMPNPQYLVNLTESKLINEEDRKAVWDLLKGAFALTSLNSLYGLTKEKKQGAEFIDDSLEFWKKKFKPGLVKIMKKVNKGWSE
ncbi:MAG: hypothetical protein KKD18_07145 [Nanoarchaeota archaeon]|nr:hypothetical protein [Nanoarchaeota archaeon]MBU0978168.1 hypothetical protein [Nanoarchaeota archaeon]